MANEKIHNLDDDVRESFRFQIKGYEYMFRQMNTEEIDEFRQIKEDKEIREYLYQFIDKTKEDEPEFREIAKKMIAPNWTKFMAMVVFEMTGKDVSN